MAIHVIKKFLYAGITTPQLDEAAAETAITMATIHPDYEKLAARIAISNLHKMIFIRIVIIGILVYQMIFMKLS